VRYVSTASRMIPVLAAMAVAALGSYAALADATDDGSSFVGLPVYSADGLEVGQVVGETKGLDGLPATIRVAVAETLGLGERIIAVAEDGYVGLRGAVTLEARAEELDGMPTAAR